MKILSIFGTRPEAIKFAPILKKMDIDQRFKSVICVTGQHMEMLSQVLEFFEITPDYNLKVMKKNQSLHELTANILLKLVPVIQKEKPDLLLVQGDTSSAFVGALAGYYEQIAVGHIEAGLRTGDIFSPFPEEGNRSLISPLATFHFAPTEMNCQNLLKENISPDNIYITGNTVIDALFLTLEKCKKRSDEYWAEQLAPNILSIVKSDKKLILITGHRRESFGDGFKNIANAILQIAQAHPDVNIIYPVHLNPNVRGPIMGILSETPNVYLVDPFNYELFIYMMNRSDIILSDSGGVQEEAPSLGKPVLVMREKTERMEAVNAGTVKLVGTSTEEIVKWVDLLITNKAEYEKMSKAENPYGDGRASEKILDICDSNRHINKNKKG